MNAQFTFTIPKNAEWNASEFLSTLAGHDLDSACEAINCALMAAPRGGCQSAHYRKWNASIRGLVVTVKNF